MCYNFQPGIFFFPQVREFLDVISEIRCVKSEIKFLPLANRFIKELVGL